MRWWKLTAITGAIGAFTAVAISVRKMPRRVESSRTEQESIVDEAGLESFPASDPPAWTLGVRG